MFEWNDFKSRNSFGKCYMPSRVIRLVTLVLLFLVKQDLHAFKQPYLSMHDSVFLTRRDSRVLPACMVKGPWLPAKFFAERYTGYWSYKRVPNFELLSVK